jgi:tetratricopeptide (TPR) repeat protein
MTSPDPRRIRIFRFIVFLFPVIFLVACEFALRRLAPSIDDNLIVTTLINNRQVAALNSSFVKRYFPRPGSDFPRFPDASFSLTRQFSSYRILFIGESTITGYPYEFNGSLHHLLADRLAGVEPGRMVEAISLGLSGTTSSMARNLMKEAVSLHPDCVVIWVGNAECYPPVGTSFTQFPRLDGFITNLYLHLEHLRIFRFIQSICSPILARFNSPVHPLTPSGYDSLASTYSIDPSGPEYDGIASRFSRNLEGIAGVASSEKIPVVFCTLPVNVRDQVPFGSRFRDGLPESAMKQWDALFASGSQLLAEGFADSALSAFKSAMSIDSSRADLRYRTGAALLRLGDTAAARQQLLRARDLDRFRLRIGSDMNDSIRSVAARTGTMCADIDHLFASMSADSMEGYPLMLEHIHPSIEGYFLIAKEIARVMREHDCIRPSAGWPKFLDDDDYKSASLMTLFDFEASLIKADNLVHRWPFNEPDSSRYRPESMEGTLAMSYCRSEISWSEAHYRLAAWYRSGNRMEDASRECLAVAKQFEFDPHPLMLAGDMLVTGLRPEAAEPFYRRAALLSPDPSADGKMGDYFFTTGKPDSALAWYLDALNLENAGVKEPRDWKLGILRNCAEIFLKRKDIGAARQIALNILAIDPKDAGALQILTTNQKEIAPRKGN